MEGVISAISNVGFPIVMCLVVCYYLNKQAETHKEEIDKLSGAVVDQTVSINNLVNKIDQLMISEEAKKNV